jgi:hypothetical protein
VNKRFCLLLLVTLFASTACGTADALSRDVSEALRSAKRFMLYSLDPRARKEGTGFHDFRLIGHVAIEDAAVRERIAATLEKHVGAGGGGALCFEPRRAIRLIVGRTIHDLVICYECHHVYIHSTGMKQRRVGIAGDPKFLDDILIAANVPIVPARK